MESLTMLRINDPEYKDLNWYTLDEEVRSPMDKSMSAGLSLYLSTSTRAFNFWTFEGGFKHTKLVHYYQFTNSILGANQVNYFQDWYYLNQYFFNIKYSQHFDKKGRSFFYLKAGTTYGNLSKAIVPTTDPGDYKGISANNTSIQAFNGGLLIEHDINDVLQLGVIGAIGLQLNLGKKRQHVFYGGVLYHQGFDSYTKSNYTTITTSATSDINEIEYTNRYFGYEFGYRMPLGVKQKSRYIRDDGPKVEQNKKGSIVVQIKPVSLLKKEAKWRVKGGEWYNSGASLEFQPNKYLVEFSPVTGYLEPEPVYVKIIKGKISKIDGIYKDISSLSPPKNKKNEGSLRVIVTPETAVDDGARWSIDDGVTWKQSGEYITGLKKGDYNIIFQETTGWTTPQDRAIEVKEGKTEVVNGTYVRKGGVTESSRPFIVAKYMQECFGEIKEAYEENQMVVMEKEIELEFVTDSPDASGGVISVCIDGKMRLEEYKIESTGRKIKLNVSGRGETYIIIKSEYLGDTEVSRFKVRVTESGSDSLGPLNQEVEIKLQQGDLHYLRIER
ncbi:MAG: hypothetical protein ACPG5P_01690 [Saprospiraceae bacterium]